MLFFSLILFFHKRPLVENTWQHGAIHHQASIGEDSSTHPHTSRECLRVYFCNHCEGTSTTRHSNTPRSLVRGLSTSCATMKSCRCTRASCVEPRQPRRGISWRGTRRTARPCWSAPRHRSASWCGRTCLTLLSTATAQEPTGTSRVGSRGRGRGSRSRGWWQTGITATKGAHTCKHHTVPCLRVVCTSVGCDANGLSRSPLFIRCNTLHARAYRDCSGGESM